MTIEWLAKPIAIGKKTAPNRIVYQPTEANNCDADGSVTDDTLRKYTALARGRPGIIHIESSDVTTRTQARSNRLLILDHNMPGLEKLVKEIRKINAESPVIFQLSHAGRLSDPVFKPPMYVYRTNGNDQIMSIRDIEQTREEFVSAARRAWKVGADGVDFKQAHSFIGDDFLHPANTRADRYGGSWENRTRFFRETLARMREEIPDRDFIIGSRITPYEGVPGAFGSAGPEDVAEDLTEPIAFAKLMEASGINFINVSAGSAAGNL
ncbi:MAG TPA: 2,4-dienoyl-CoA reductase, partial [Spirochaetia bacterium]|nr:2,4-dienoyl-CoA reductase [Spirochaetia bacterium]